MKFEINEKLTKFPLKIMENKLFTNLVEENFKELPLFFWTELLDHISSVNNLNCEFMMFGAMGEKEDIKKAVTILANSIKYN